MGIHDRDWYKDEMKKRAAKTGPFSFDRPKARRSSPPEPHEWPAWLVALAWILVFGAVLALIQFFVVKPRKQPASADQGISIRLPDCSSVASGLCVKR